MSGCRSATGTPRTARTGAGASTSQPLFAAADGRGVIGREIALAYMFSLETASAGVAGLRGFRRAAQQRRFDVVEKLCRYAVGLPAVEVLERSVDKKHGQAVYR